MPAVPPKTHEIDAALKRIESIDGISSNYYRIELLFNVFVQHMHSPPPPQASLDNLPTPYDMVKMALVQGNLDTLLDEYTSIITVMRQKMCRVRRMFRALSTMQLLRDELRSTMKSSVWSSLAYQDILVNEILIESMTSEFGAAHDYCLDFSRLMLNELQQYNVEVHETLIDTHMKLLRAKHVAWAPPLPSFCTLEYDENMCVRLWTTRVMSRDLGLVVWPAGLLLADYCLTHSELVRHRVCVELGAGVGVTALIVARLHPHTLIVTDYSTNIINNLKYTFKLNHVKNVIVRKLDWLCDEDLDTLDELNADTIFIADTIYAPELIEPSVTALSRALHTQGSKAIAANCIRSTENFMHFLQCLQAHNLHYEHVKMSDIPQRFHVPRPTNLSLLCITR